MYDKLEKIKFSDQITIRLDTIEARLARLDAAIRALHERLDAMADLDKFHTREVLELRGIIAEAIDEASWQRDSLDDKKQLLHQYKHNLDKLKLQQAKRGFDLSLANQIEETEQRIAEIESEIEAIR